MLYCTRTAKAQTMFIFPAAAGERTRNVRGGCQQTAISRPRLFQARTNQCPPFPDAASITLMAPM